MDPQVLCLRSALRSVSSVRWAHLQDLGQRGPVTVWQARLAGPPPSAEAPVPAVGSGRQGGMPTPVQPAPDAEPLPPPALSLLASTVWTTAVPHENIWQWAERKDGAVCVNTPQRSQTFPLLLFFWRHNLVFLPKAPFPPSGNPELQKTQHQRM